MAGDRCDLLCLDLPRAEHIRRQLDVELAGHAAARAKALADPNRLQIALALLEGEELCVCDLAWVVAKAENLSATTFARYARPASRTRAVTARSFSTR